MKLMPTIASAAAAIAFTVALLHGKEEPEADAVVPVYAVKEDTILLNAMAKEDWELQQVIVVLSMVDPFKEGPSTVAVSTSSQFCSRGCRIPDPYGLGCFSN